MAATVTVLSITGASLAIISRTALLGRDLHSLKSKLNTADKKIKQLSTHVGAVRVAARALSTWLADQTLEGPRSEDFEDLKVEIFEVLYSCLELLLDLQNHVEAVLACGGGGPVAGSDRVKLGKKGSAMAVWDEEIVRDTIETLHGQETALLLMLETLRLTQKSDKKRQPRSRRDTLIIEKAKRPCSAIFQLAGNRRASVLESPNLEVEEVLKASSVYGHLDEGVNGNGAKGDHARTDSALSFGSEGTLVETSEDQKPAVEKHEDLKPVAETTGPASTELESPGDQKTVVETTGDQSPVKKRSWRFRR